MDDVDEVDRKDGMDRMDKVEIASLLNAFISLFTSAPKVRYTCAKLTETYVL